MYPNLVLETSPGSPPLGAIVKGTVLGRVALAKGKENKWGISGRIEREKMKRVDVVSGYYFYANSLPQMCGGKSTR
jgi:hypothetical protein